MNLDSLRKRLDALKPTEGAILEQQENELSKLFVKSYERHFLRRLDELGCSGLIDEFKAAFLTVGPRPLQHTRPDDRPVWFATQEVTDRHEELTYRIRAAGLDACADAEVELGASENEEKVLRLRRSAASYMEMDEKDRQTTCDRCGSDLDGWNCLAWPADGQMQKICRRCRDRAGQLYGSD